MGKHFLDAFADTSAYLREQTSFVETCVHVENVENKSQSTDKPTIQLAAGPPLKIKSSKQETEEEYLNLLELVRFFNRICVLRGDFSPARSR